MTALLLAVLAPFLWAQDIDGLNPPARLPSPGEGQEMVGRPAPDWGRLTWIDSKQRPRPKDLRGQVVLVRWWTDGCLYCVDAAPVLNRLHETYGQRGLVVIGMYHPKPPRSVDAQGIREAAEILGFRFPVAIDPKWKALRRYGWGEERAFTTVSFLIGPDGIIRWVHPGGTYSPETAADLERRIVELLPQAEPVPAKS